MYFWYYAKFANVLDPQICTESSSLGSSFKHKVQADVGIVYHGVVPTLFGCFLGGIHPIPGEEGEEKGPGFSCIHMRLIISDLTTC